MVQSISKPVLDFTGYIKERTANFTGRMWVFQAINDWLADSNGSRFFLLTGEPGSGKTAIASQLSQFSAGAIPPPDGLVRLKPNFLNAQHFCSARDNRWINPRVFAESLATQLAESHPVYAKALAEKSGERSIHIEVQQRIERGQAVGVLIKKLDVSGATPEDAFDRVVREPLESLAAEEMDRQVIILVDALDEALSSTINPTIVSLLSQTDNLPSCVRFVLTSRLEIDVLRPLRRSHPKELTLTSGQGLIQSLQDVQLYAQHTLDKNSELENKLPPGLSRQPLIDAIHKKSGGNFLYVRYLLTMLQEQQEQINLAQLDTLPTGLDGIYLEFLERLVKSDAHSWENKYASIIGALAVAQIPLNEAQLSDLAGQSGLSTTLKRLRQLLDVDETLPLSKRTYTIYHHSFIDFLLDKDRSEEYGRDERGEHLRLAHWCEGGDLSIIWEDVKYSSGEQGRREYARKHYVTHLYLSREWQQLQKQRLFEVLDTVQYGQGKLQHDPSTRSYVRDLDLGRQAASWEGWSVEQGITLLPYLWRYTLLRCSLASRADSYPLEAFEALVLLRRDQEAINLAELLTKDQYRASVMLLIARQMGQQSTNKQERLDLLERVYKIAVSGEANEEKVSLLIGISRELAKAQQWERAEAIANTLESISDQAQALKDICRELAKAQQWEQAQAVAFTIKSGEQQSQVLKKLCIELAKAQQWERTETVVHTIGSRREQVIALSRLGTELAQMQQWERAKTVWNKAKAIADTMRLREDGTIDIWSSSRRDEALCELSIQLANMQQWEQAKKIAYDIESGSMRMKPLAELSVQLAKAQQPIHAEEVWKEAEAMIHFWKEQFLGAAVHMDDYNADVEESWRESKDLLWLARKAIQAKQWERANALAHDLGSKGIEVLGKLSVRLAEADQWEQAEATWEQAEEMALNIGPNGMRAIALLELSAVLVEANQWKRVQALWSKIQMLLQEVKSLEDKDKIFQALLKQITILTQAEKWDQAEDVWKTFLLVIHNRKDSTEKIRDDFLLSTPISEDNKERNTILNELTEMQRREEIHKELEIVEKKYDTNLLLQLVLELSQTDWQRQVASIVTHTIPEPWTRARTLQKLSKELARMQLWDQAETVSSMIELVKIHWITTEALIDLGLELALSKQWKRASNLWYKAERIAYQFEQKEAKARILLKLSAALAQVGQWKRVKSLWFEVETAAHAIKDVLSRSRVLSELGLDLAQASQYEYAEAIASMIERIEDRSNLLINIAKYMSKAGRYEDILHLVQRSWAQAITRESSVQLFPLVASLISIHPQMGVEFHQGFIWVDNF